MATAGRASARVPAPLVFAALAGLAGVVLVLLGAGMTFFSDEWAFIESRSLANPVDWLRPHNEHWSTLPVILYRAMVETIGIGSYVPYLVAVIALHLVVAALVFRLVRRRLGDLPALAAGMIVLFFGSGFENLYWGFQTGFVGSMALGLAALEVIDAAGPTPRRAASIAVLLLLSLMASGTGLMFCVAVGLEWLLEPRWRRWLPLLALPGGAYVAWYLTFGRTGIATQRSPFTLDALGDVPVFVVRGFLNALQAISGIPEQAGILALVALGAAIVRLARRRRLPARAVGLLTAILAQYALIGLVRGGLFEGQVAYTRYTYVSGILMLVAVASVLASIGLPRRPVVRRAGVALLATCFALAMGLNLALLVAGRALFLDRADMTRALVTVGLTRPLPAPTDPERTLVLVPSPAALEAIVRAHGDPRTDSLVPWAVRPIPAAVMTEAQRRLEEGAPIPVAGG